MNELLQKLKEQRRIFLPGLIVAALVAALLLWAVAVRVVLPSNRYAQAEHLLEAGRFSDAAQAFEALGEYADAAQRCREAKFAQAEALLAEGKFEEAISAFKALGDYNNAGDRIQQVRYARAEELLAQGKYEEAAAAFYALGDYGDAYDRIQDTLY